MNIDSLINCVEQVQVDDLVCWCIYIVYGEVLIVQQGV